MPDGDQPSPEAHDAPGVGASGRGIAVGIFAILLLGVVAIVALLSLRDGGGGETVTYVVDAGTGELLDAGEAVEIMPAEVRLSVGDTLVIRNDDDRDYVIGPYFVRAGETLQQTYTRAQELTGACELSGHGELRVVVS